MNKSVKKDQKRINKRDMSKFNSYYFKNVVNEAYVKPDTATGKRYTIAFEGKELELIEWALGDMFDNAEKALAQSKWGDKELDAYSDRIFELLEKVRKARNN